MRTTLILPDELLAEAMQITNISTKTKVVTVALENLIQREKILALKNFFGKVDLDIDLGQMRSR